MCAFRSRARPPPLPRATATTFDRPGAASPTDTSTPARSSHSATKRAIAASRAPPGISDGLTESIATNRRSNSINSEPAALDEGEDTCRS